MIAQVVFTAVLMAVVLVAISQLAQLPLVGGLVICVAVFGTYLVWMPEGATQIAHFVGIGRGADLLLYVWVLISLSILLILYLAVREQLELITSLARKIALTEATSGTAEHSASANDPVSANKAAHGPSKGLRELNRNAGNVSNPTKHISQKTLAK